MDGQIDGRMEASSFTCNAAACLRALVRTSLDLLRLNSMYEEEEEEEV